MSGGGRTVTDVKVPDGHATAERRSLAYHRAVAARLDEPLVARARQTLDRWVSLGTITPRYERRWRELLDRPIPELAAAITADDERGRDLRQASPFAGVLSAPERWAIIREVG